MPPRHLRLTFLLSLCLLLGASVSAAANQKNVLFIMVDDLRPQLNFYADAPGQHGARQMKTPALDSLAGESFVFERAYCSVPICGASRLSLLTGSRPYKEPGERWGRHWTYTSRLQAASNDEPANLNNPGITLPQHLKANGYTMLSIGKVYHNKQDDSAIWDDLVKEQHAWHGTPAFEAGTGDKNHDEAYPDGRNASHVLAKLEEVKDEPFFYGVGFPRPHLPFVAPEKYWALYDREDITLPSNYFPPINAPAESLHNWGELRNYSELEFQDESEKKLTDEYARSLLHGYYASVSYMDAQIGRIIDKLKTTYDSDGTRLYDKTIIILWGDHGYNLGEHSLWAKHALYNTALQVPLLIRDPDEPRGSRIPALVETVDLYPTLCDMLGIARPAPSVDNDGTRFALEGTSLLPLMRDPQAPWKEAIFARFIFGDTIRTQRYAYTEYTTVDDQLVSTMLYDLQQDPDENYNIAAQNPELASALSKLLGASPTEKRYAWRQLVDTENLNAPLSGAVDLPPARYPTDYVERLSRIGQ